MKRRLAAALLAVVLLSGTAGCVWEPCSSGCSGNVVAREMNRTKYGRHYWITVQEDQTRNRDRGRVSGEVYAACPLGARWPDCKKGVPQ
jgi:hypothetical protein